MSLATPFYFPHHEPTNQKEIMATKSFPVPAGFTKGPRPEIALLAVKSSQVRAIGYDTATQTMAVQFALGAGHIYHYPNVTPEAHKAFFESDSIGVHFGKFVKQLPFEKYENVPEPTTAAA